MTHPVLSAVGDSSARGTSGTTGATQPPDVQALLLVTTLPPFGYGWNLLAVRSLSADTGGHPGKGMNDDFRTELKRLRASRGLSLRMLAKLTHYSSRYLHEIETGRKPASPELAATLDDALDASGTLTALVHGSAVDSDDEIGALELVRRVAATDVGSDTLDHLEMAVDDLCVAYPGTPPADLLGRVRRHLGYVERLLDGRKTLAEHRRLIVTGGWLSLLAATCEIDLHEFPAANARLRTAAQLAKHAEHPEIAAWCLETQAWQVLTSGDFRRAVTLAQGSQEIAPYGSSAYIQATAQEGRAWARLGSGAETRNALERVDRLVSPLPMPDRPEHHYQYDPAKSDAYTATTLSWLGDPAAEPYARGVLHRLESTTDGPPRPRRAASARLDLALALLAADKPDEAGATALAAVASGRLVPSNYWRAAEVIQAVVARRIPEADELHEAYREICGPDT